MPITQINFNSPAALPGYILSPTGGIVRYVYNGGAATLDLLPAGVQDICDLSLDSAMSKCRDNRGDTIIMLPGHVDTLATAASVANMKAGVTVMGVGNGDERPAINWTAAASAVALAKANVRIENCILNFAKTAATTVAAPIQVTAAAFILSKCRLIFSGAGGTQLCTVGIEYKAGSDRSQVLDCEIEGAADGAVTDHFLVSAAIDRFRFRRNLGSSGPAGANGILRFSAAATNIIVDENTIENTLAGASSTAVFVGFAGLTGQFPWNALSVQNNGTASGQGIIVPGNTRANQTYTSDEAGKSGLLSPVAAT